MTVTKPPPFDPDNFEPIRLGPTWKTDANGDWILPDLTLGWGIVAWAAQWLTNDDGEPWIFTLEQLRFVLWFYAVDERGRFVYRDTVLQRCKGWGKDPLAAVICLAELIGPCRFSHFEDGLAVGKENPAAWVQMAAVSFEQNKNTMLLIPTLLPDRTRLEFGMDVGKEKIRARGGRRLLEAITSASRSSEGNRPSFFLANETHHWTSTNGGHDMWDVVERNATKSKGGNTRTLAITNAYMPGENSIAEITREAYNKMSTINPETGLTFAVDTGLLYDSLEAPSNAPLTAEAIPKVLMAIRGDAIWLDIEAITKSCLDIRNPASRSRRFWFNQIVADEETLIAPAQWDPLEVTDQLEDGDEIVLGFDGGRTDDATALIAIRVRDKFICPLGIWEKPKGPNHDHWEVDRMAVDGSVDNAFARFHVVAFLSDVFPWESYVDAWSDRYRDQLIVKANPGKSAIGYDMRGHQEEIVLANQHFVSAIFAGQYRHSAGERSTGYGRTLREHVMNTRRTYTKWGMGFGKESRESSKKNDGYAATLLATIALTKYLESGRRPEKARSGKVHMF